MTNDLPRAVERQHDGLFEEIGVHDGNELKMRGLTPGLVSANVGVCSFLRTWISAPGLRRPMRFPGDCPLTVQGFHLEPTYRGFSEGNVFGANRAICSKLRERAGTTFYGKRDRTR